MKAGDILLAGALGQMVTLAPGDDVRMEVAGIGLVVGIDEKSEGLAMARAHGIATTHEGIEGLKTHPLYKEIGIAFDATSAYAHNKALRADGIHVVDLTPAAIGPFTVPPVNMS